MALRRLLLSVLLVLFASRVAEAEDWRIQSLEGTARTFAHGEWTDAQAGAALPLNAIVQTGDEGRARLGRGPDAILLAPGAKVSLEEAGGALVRAFEGGLGAEVAPTQGARFLTMTTYASVEARDAAAFGLVLEPYGAAVGVRSGVVVVKDLLSQATVEVSAGQIVHVRSGQPLLPKTAKGDEPAMTMFWGGAVAVRSPAPAGDAVGALASGARRLAKSVDPFKLGLGAWDKSYDGAEPWDDSFEWTQVEDGAVRLKPLWRIILDLRLPEAYEFWFLTFVVCLFLGAGANAMMERSGLTLGGSTLLVALAFAAAILVRDLFFRSGANIAIEPFLSIGMMLAATTASLLSGAYAKVRLS